MSFLTVCLNPTIQKTLRFPSIVPGTVNRTALHRLDVSGKGINVTRVLTQLGKKAAHLTQLGGDMRPLFLSLCEQDGLSVVWAESGSQIRFCYTVLTDNDSGVTELVEEAEPVCAGTEERLLEKFDNLLEDGASGGRGSLSASSSSSASGSSSANWLIISGTKAAGFSGAVIPDMVRKAKEKGLKIILDVKGNDLIESLKYEPDIIKPNLFEFASTFIPELIKNNDLITENCAVQEQIKPIVMDVTRKFKCRVILTNGSRKILAAAPAGHADRDVFFETDIQPIKAVNTIGCGDAFTAGLAAALDDGAEFTAAIAEGIRCGALNAAAIRPGVIKKESI